MKIANERRMLDRDGLGRLFSAIAGRGYRLVGPTVRDQAIVYGELDGIASLPEGWTDDQAPGRYRLERRDDDALFGYAVGPHSWKRFVHPARLPLWRAHKTADGIAIEPHVESPERLALIGVRACELAALGVLDGVFLGGENADPGFAARRANLLIIAVNCTSPAQTCFCSSMDTGPRAKSGYDLALTEIVDGDRHEFLVEIGTDAGATILADVAPAAAGETLVDEAAAAIEAAAASMTRRIDKQAARELLARSADSPHWDVVASRCLACTNCTMVCPTCFCTDVEDVTDLSGETAERTRVWDSCYNLSFSYLHGGSVRTSIASRYRQWLTHKLSSWYDQFGTSGCVGCGRCITWCPPGIDLTEEVKSIAALEVPAGHQEQGS